MSKINLTEAKALAKRFVGINRSQFAREHGVPGGGAMIYQHINGLKPISLDAAKAYARGFGCSIEEISSDAANKLYDLPPVIPAAVKERNVSTYTVGNIIAHHPDDPLSEDDVLVPEYRVSFSAGPGSAPEYEIVEESEPAIYKISWFRKEHINPKSAKRFKVRHDSMVPLLYPGDTILVNLAENSIADIIDGKVYAIRYGNELRVKKLQALLDGSLVLKSENPAYHDEILTPETVEEHITIIGRVRDKSGAGGL